MAKDGLQKQNETRFGVEARGVPNSAVMPDVGAEVMNKRMPIGKSEPSLNSATERMGAAKPWVPKGGHAVAAANAKDPGNDKASTKFVPAPSPGFVKGRLPDTKKAGGPSGTPAGQGNAGGYAGASGNGGYS
ncbi:MAG: hypothetical protein KAS32_24495 [Candidatus Peribacteraceae bacterium]|nr:hypothetical protein [Candidatus Peribacteraceae bacterium]